MSVCVQPWSTRSGNVEFIGRQYGLACSSLRGMSEVPHPVLDRIQSVPQRLLPAAGRPQLESRVDAVLLLRNARQSKPVGIG